MTYEHRVFETKREAFRRLAGRGMCSVGWSYGGKSKEACYRVDKVLIRESTA